ncbi:MAG: alkaline phosphatase family protein [Flavobacteriaceae bacterium]|nr:alkaline phosphatase family protein [Flavobacteriaceae bacterium]
MKYFIFLLFPLVIVSCKTGNGTVDTASNVLDDTTDFVLAFASCNDQDRPQPLWDPIVGHAPDLFIWGGDNIYADTQNMEKMKSDYDKVLAQPSYQKLMASTAIIGTWDDHDYGKNDAGKEWNKKAEAQKLFLDFLKTPKQDERYGREGVYSSYTATVGTRSIKFILLDTRTFRDALQKSRKAGKRYEPWLASDTEKTLLGEKQWNWLEEELKDDSSEFTILVTSIQFLNTHHGWESWGNFPAEIAKMENLLRNAKAKNILMVSGDRHMAEISRKKIKGLAYPMIDFTTSGMTHTWIDGATEGNRYRISNVIKHLNFGVLRFDLDAKKVTFEIRGEDDFLYERYEHQY